MNNPSNKIFLLGMMGSGKSYWGRRIAATLGYTFYDLDELLVQEEGQTINEIFNDKGEQYFRDRETEVLKDTFLISENIVLATGGGVPCFNNNMELINEHGISIWLNEPIEILYERLAKERAHRPLLKNLTDEGLKGFIQQKLTERNPFYNQAKYTVTQNDLTDSFIKKLVNR